MQLFFWLFTASVCILSLLGFCFWHLQSMKDLSMAKVCFVITCALVFFSFYIALSEAFAGKIDLITKSNIAWMFIQAGIGIYSIDKLTTRVYT